jgi:hypothetical protein
MECCAIAGAASIEDHSKDVRAASEYSKGVLRSDRLERA